MKTIDCLLDGPPGSGKSQLAEALPMALRALETTLPRTRIELWSRQNQSSEEVFERAFEFGGNLPVQEVGQ